jgi:hypothetical protein
VKHEPTIHELTSCKISPILLISFGIRQPLVSIPASTEDSL